MASKDKKEEVLNEEEIKNTQENKAESISEEKEEKQDTNPPKEEKKKSSKKKKSSATSELEKKDKEIEDLRYKMSEINDKYMRLSAEFDNYRKRTLKEKSDLIKTAGCDVLADVLPVVDDFERAMIAMENAENITAVKEGVNLIFNKFSEFIKSKGIVEIEALNMDFDTDMHEALTKIPAHEENLKGKVVDVIQKGYKIEEKVIRYAKVVVGE
ncbi:MAG: nucleotide exchange factor GrpE [Salinivirgaceae bacterium]|jgi:molecular chaperone GrpE|nr:nucleotide exchange factor GrpE [Salinivirgaceae bacterium]